ncbi:sulfite exporter TauE/SafE family protein [Acidomonas methanolica]|uniref:sulfite exporter TauE/SafE family protein n=1 Tax=Acidomonas methanolica TaxID=437 RepID=UPI00207B9209|nr:sulfite exporter TauE/SafE family protein [Acidomonas methanolica]
MMFGFIALFAIASAAFALSAVSGGGAGLIVMPVLGVLLAADHVPAALSIGTAVSSVSRIALFFKAIRWPVVLRFVPLALPAAWGGIVLLKQIQPAYLDFLLGLFLLGNLPLVLRRPKKDGTTRDAGGMTWLPVVGALAGFISGFTGAVGLLFNGFYHRLGLRKEEIVATRAANDILLHLVKVALYAVYGLIDQATLTAGITVAIAALVSSAAMKMWLHHIPDHMFRQIGHGAAVVAGIAMMVLAGRQISVQNHMAVHYARSTDEAELALDWRRHRLSVELENPAELEIRHYSKGQDVVGNGLSRTRPSAGPILHVSLTRGVYVTRVSHNRHRMTKDADVNML